MDKASVSLQIALALSQILSICNRLTLKVFGLQIYLIEGVVLVREEVRLLTCS